MEQPNHSRHPSVQEQMSKTQLRMPKKLIVCCDGTWMDADNGWKKGSWGKPGKLQNPSNVTRIARAVKSEDDQHHPQIVYYQAGVGTGIGLYDQIVGGGTGLGLSENIREAYAFLAANYAAADEQDGHTLADADSIFLLGFSRGAFTARSLGGFIGAVGILTKKALPCFYECFLDWENAGSPSYTPQFIESYVRGNPDEKLSVEKNRPSLALAHTQEDHGIDKYMLAYRKHLLALGLTHEAKIKAIGVWDTVGALGIPINPWLQRLFHLPSFIKEYRWFDTRLDNCVENAFQALALDEYRFPYSPAVWQLDPDGQTNLKQVYFPGAHSNVGGSYDDYGIANITLAWMMDQMSGNSRKPAVEFNARDWIRFDEQYIETCFRQNSYYYAKHSSLDAYKGWTMGKVYDSCTFPQSLAGTRTRSPGMYHKTDYITGHYTSELLQNTCEYIHSSVRARMDLAGRGVEPQRLSQKLVSWIRSLITLQNKSRHYKPQRRPGWFSKAGPLHGWKLYDGHESHAEPNLNIDMSPGGLREIHWEYEGTGKTSTPKLDEDVFAEGGYEEKLLLHDQEIANKIIFSNNRWQWFKRPGKHHFVSHTF